MNITSGLVLFAITWFLVFFVVLQIRFQSQEEAGDVTLGTQRGTSAKENVGQSAKITTAITAVIWVLLFLIITSGWITVENMDVFGILNRVPPAYGQ
jgi:predicted secreted protein